MGHVLMYTCVCVCVGMCVRVCVCALSTLRLVKVPERTPPANQREPDLLGLGLLELDLLGSLARSLACSLTCSLCPLGSTADLRERRTRKPRSRMIGGGSESARIATPRRETSLCALPVRHGIRVLKGGG